MESAKKLSALLGKTLIIVAHPDDEALTCGALLQRMQEPAIVFATDGAPRDSFFWQKFGSRHEYACIRREEARRALATVKVSQINFLAQDDGSNTFVDQELFRVLPLAIDRISALIARLRPQVLLTLAYEGGHPDHDCCSFITAALAREHSLPAWEMPLYHRSTDGVVVRQDFRSPNGEEVVFQPTAAELEARRRMISAYRSQSEVLGEFTADLERFRPMASYDYSQPPHVGILNYEAWRWSVSGADLCRAFTAFLESRQLQEDGAIVPLDVPAAPPVPIS